MQTFREPPFAVEAQVHSFERQPFSLGHFRSSKCPSFAIWKQVYFFSNLFFAFRNFWIFFSKNSTKRHCLVRHRKKRDIRIVLQAKYPYFFIFSFYSRIFEVLSKNSTRQKYLLRHRKKRHIQGLLDVRNAYFFSLRDLSNLFVLLNASRNLSILFASPYVADDDFLSCPFRSSGYPLFDTLAQVSVFLSFSLCPRISGALSKSSTKQECLLCHKERRDIEVLLQVNKYFFEFKKLRKFVGSIQECDYGWFFCVSYTTIFIPTTTVLFSQF